MFGSSIAFGYLGQFLFLGAGGPLFDKVSVFAPFIIMMCLDGAYVLFSLLAIKCGWIYDDISKRKMNEYKIKET